MIQAMELYDTHIIIDRRQSLRLLPLYILHMSHRMADNIGVISCHDTDIARDISTYAMARALA